ncbi:hypothetical protein BH23GEM1_BH23GEM1_02310 [soil metagenome]
MKNGFQRIGSVVGLDRRTGREIWRYDGPAGPQGGAEGSPVIVGRVLAFNEQSGGAIRAVDRFTGAELWRVVGEAGFFGPVGTPAVVGDTIYSASADTRVYAIHAPAGKVVWSTKGDGSYGNVAACANRVFAENLGIDIRDRRTGQILARVVASRGPDFDYAFSGIGSDGNQVYVVGPFATYAISCR